MQDMQEQSHKADLNLSVLSAGYILSQTPLTSNQSEEDVCSHLYILNSSIVSTVHKKVYLDIIRNMAQLPSFPIILMHNVQTSML